MKRFEMKLTEGQYTALMSLKRLKDEELAIIIRRLIKTECQEYMIIFPDDMPTKSDNVLKRYPHR